MKNNVTSVVLKKELLDIFRDKKTIIISILLPLIIFPILFGVMGKSLDKTQKQVEENLTVAIIDENNSSLGKLLKSQSSIKIIDSSDIDKDIKSGKILLGIVIPKDFESSVEKEATAKVEVVYDNSSQQGNIALGMVNSIIDSFSKEIVKIRLTKRNIDTAILSPLEIVKRTTEKESTGSAIFMLSLMLPLLLITYSVSGPMAPATDLGAGEKERGTLEPLLTTQADRMSLLWGKFFAITVMGVITAATSIMGLFIAMQQQNSMFQGASGAQITPVALVLIGLVSILLTMGFGALELSISIYARSFKEAQTYISPLLIISFIPVYATYMLDAKNIDLIYFNIPLANAACLIKEFISGIYNPLHIGITFMWILVYVLVSILFARFMFSREEVIFRT